MIKYCLLIGSIIFLLWGCSQTNEDDNKADLILHGGTIYTVDSSFTIVEAVAVKDGKIIATGTDEEILKKYTEGEKVDLAGQIVYPGFFDAHCHFYGYGLNLQKADLMGTTSFEQVVEQVTVYAKINPDKAWILGRGWDQNDWEVKEFPTNDKLNTLFPDKPILLTRIDGHAALANQKALDLAGITSDTKISGGTVVLKNGKPSGVLIDNAIELVSAKIPAYTKEENQKALLAAQEKCFAVGLTSIADAGLDREIIEEIQALQKSGKLDMRIYAMISATEANLNYYPPKGKLKTDKLNVCSFKIYADGALGSRGACLLHPYQDKPKEKGFLLSSPENLENVIRQIREKGFQANTHCIGDSANRLLLDIYGKYLQGKNNLRWRIEHAQIVSKEDIAKYGQYSIIPSVQPTHCTSDMAWAGVRLGQERLETAYTYKDLYSQNNMIAFGSDFPVEDINPLYGFHAAVARQDGKGNPEGGFQIENAVSRLIALKAMTIWAAYANFEEKEKGSIEVGKFADFVVLDKDIMKEEFEDLRAVKVVKTIVGGKVVYGK